MSNVKPMNPNSVLFREASPFEIGSADAACNGSNPVRVATVEEMIDCVNKRAGCALIWGYKYDTINLRHSFYWEVVVCHLRIEADGWCFLTSDEIEQPEAFRSLSQLTQKLLEECDG